MQPKVALLKVFVGTLSAPLSVEGHKMSVEVLRAIHVITVHLTGLLLMAMMDTGHLKMPIQQSLIQKLMSFR